jgi:glycosyltransferase involved in cell wall biosynthesis
MPMLDVLIPCYGYGRLLERSIRSVLDQEKVDVRVLVIDDASPDDTPEVARRLAAEDRRVRWTRHAENRGHIETYNEGIDAASAPFFLLLSADDMLAPGAAARAVGLMRREPHVVLSHGAWIDLVEGDPVPVIDGGDAPWSVETGPEFIERTSRTALNLVGTPTAIVRTSAQKRAGHYRASLPHAGDLEMWLRLAMLGDTARTPAVQAIKGVHQANMSLTVEKGAYRNYEQVEAAFAAFFEGPGRRLTEAAEWHEAARRRLSHTAYWTAMAHRLRGEAEDAAKLRRFAGVLDPAVERLPPFDGLIGQNVAARAAAAVTGLVKRLRF